jgi:hypothetical protein
MAWPDVSREIDLADALKAALEDLPEWLALEPLPNAVQVLDWPTESIAGPRALIHTPALTYKADAQTLCNTVGTITVEIHVPVEVRPAIAAFGSLRDACAQIQIPGVRILNAKILRIERGKYVSSTAASLGDTPADPDQPEPAWNRASAVAYRCDLTLDILQANP